MMLPDPQSVRPTTENIFNLQIKKEGRLAWGVSAEVDYTIVRVFFFFFNWGFFENKVGSLHLLVFAAPKWTIVFSFKYVFIKWPKERRAKKKSLTLCEISSFYNINTGHPRPGPPRLTEGGGLSQMWFWLHYNPGPFLTVTQCIIKHSLTIK